MSRRKDRAAQQTEIERLTAAIATPLLARVPGSHHVVVACPKGGTGKTTTAAMLGLNLADVRGEIVSVVDANPHMSTLRRRLVSPAVPPTRPFVELLPEPSTRTSCPSGPLWRPTPTWSRGYESQ